MQKHTRFSVKGGVRLLLSLITYHIMKTCGQGWIQVLWGLKLVKFLEPTLRKRIQNYKYKIRYESEYLFWAPPRVLEGAHASEEP
jgi:hypothetical protein